MALAAMKREFLEGKNLSFVLLLPSSNTGKSVLAGGFALLLFPSNLSSASIVGFLDSHVDLKGMVKKAAGTHETDQNFQLLLSSLPPPHRSLGTPGTGAGARDSSGGGACRRLLSVWGRRLMTAQTPRSI